MVSFDIEKLIDGNINILNASHTYPRAWPKSDADVDMLLVITGNNKLVVS